MGLGPDFPYIINENFLSPKANLVFSTSLWLINNFTQTILML